MTGTRDWSTGTAPAKVNLALAVTGRRGDGYHELRSVFLRIELADRVALRAIPAHGPPQGGRSDRLLITGDAGCPVVDNLVLRAIGAARAAASADGSEVPRYEAVLTKAVPMAAGLGGGSSDAATTLRLLAAEHPSAVPHPVLERLARDLGADVPFFLDGAGASLVTGTGDGLEPLPPPIEPLGLLLLVPGQGAPTGSVFHAYDQLGSQQPGIAGVVDDLAGRLRAGADPEAICAIARELRDANDLWAPAARVVPGLADLRSTLEGRLGRPVLLTGAGSTLFALYASPGDARIAAEHLRAAPVAGLRVLVTRSTGPDIPTNEHRREP